MYIVKILDNVIKTIIVVTVDTIFFYNTYRMKSAQKVHTTGYESTSGRKGDQNKKIVPNNNNKY